MMVHSKPEGGLSIPTEQADEGVVVLQTARGSIDVDTSIAPIVAALNAAGVETIASCSGHGHRPGNIALRDGRELIIARDFAEGRLIDGLFSVGASGARLTDDAALVLPRDVTVNHITFRRGTSWETFIAAATRWHNAFRDTAGPTRDLRAEMHAITVAGHDFPSAQYIKRPVA